MFHYKERYVIKKYAGRTNNFGGPRVENPWEKNIRGKYPRKETREKEGGKREKK
jgi:hypothetical protein